MLQKLTTIPAILAVLWRMKRRKPAFMSFNVSNRCNEQCLMCSVWRTRSDELSLPEMETIFRGLRDFGIRVLEISGGEPFLRKDIFDILELTDRTGFLFTVSTNGTLLDAKLAERLNAFPRLLQLAVSLDSLDRECYRKLRGVDALSRVLGNLEAFVHKKPRFPVKLNFTMSRFNYRETMKMLGYAERLGIYLSVFPVNQGAGFFHRSSESGFTPSDAEKQDMAGLFRALAELRKQGAPLWDFSRFYELAADYVSGKPVGPCDAGALYLDLHSDGIVAPCVELDGFADLRKERIGEVYHRLASRKPRLAACAETTPCCYTCTYHISVTAAHLVSFMIETLRVRGLHARRKRPEAGDRRGESREPGREDGAWTIRNR